VLDPQIRLLLEAVYESSENGIVLPFNMCFNDSDVTTAGIPFDEFAGSNTSVHIGSFAQDYGDGHRRDLDALPSGMLVGNGNAMVSNRISHFFDLRGPSMTVDTGCSASMVALHLACQGIRTGESTMAVVGGSNLMLNPDFFLALGSLGLVVMRDSLLQHVQQYS
jgi:acyl transferase domain-containing protein